MLIVSICIDSLADKKRAVKRNKVIIWESAEGRDLKERVQKISFIEFHFNGLFIQ